MSYDDYDAEASEDDLRNVLVGRRIVDADTKKFTLTLDDGTVLEFASTADCCAWFDPDKLEWIDYDDNVITAVEQVKTGTGDDDYDILILSASKQIAKLGVAGSEGNGSYVHHVGMRVHKPMTHNDLDRAIDLVRDVRDDLVRDVRDNLGLDSTYYSQISQATVLQYAVDLSDAVDALVAAQVRLEGGDHHD